MAGGRLLGWLVIAAAACSVLLVAAAPAQAQGSGCPIQRPVWPNSPDDAAPSDRVDELEVEGVPVNVLLPPDYSSSKRRYPVLFLLHGGLQWEDTYLVLSDIETFTAGLDESQQAIVVMPDGGLGTYTDGNPGASAWERFHTRTLVRHIDEEYRTVAERSHRAITGESGGGLGTTFYAARHPDLFVAAGPLSGLLDITDPHWLALTFGPGNAYNAQCQDGPGGKPVRPFLNPANDFLWYANASPTVLVRNLGATALYVASGNGVPCDPNDLEDSGSVYPLFEPEVRRTADKFLAAAHEAGIHPTVELPSCGMHSFKYFERYLHHFWLGTMLTAFGTPPPRSFDYRRADARFSVWGWTFTADPRRAPEFLDITDASQEGATFTGSGTQSAKTARYFRPRQRVRLTGATEPVERADRRGSIRFQVDLGPPHTAQQYTAEARLAGQDLPGYFTTRQVRFDPE